MRWLLVFCYFALGDVFFVKSLSGDKGYQEIEMDGIKNKTFIINMNIKTICTFLFFSVLLTNCSEIQEGNKEERIDEKKTKSVNNTLFDIEGVQIFKVSNRSYFKTDSILNLFKNNENYLSGFFVPFSLSVVGNNVYIPNRTEKLIYVYSKKGELFNTIEIPQQYSPDYVMVTENNFIIVNDFDSSTLFLLDSNNIEYKSANHDLKFSSFSDNVLFKKNALFFDRQGYFNGEYGRKFSLLSNDYCLASDSLLCVVYRDEDDGNWRLEIVTSGGVIQENVKLNLPEDINTYPRVNILYANDNECLFVLTDLMGSIRKSTVVKYNTQLNYAELYSLGVNYDGEVFIGEGAALWSNGVIFYYTEKENVVYAMLTGSEYIYVYRFVLRSE